MRQPLRSWTNTLARLGFKRRKKVSSRKTARRRPAVEGLEDRCMMSADPILIDDGDAGFSTTGFEYWQGEEWDYVGDDVHAANWHSQASSGDVATYTFSNLTPGVYSVQNMWVDEPNRATNVSIEILDGATQVGSITQNQQGSGVVARTGDLGTYTIQSNSLTVRIFGVANGVVAADAVQITKERPTVTLSATDASAGEGTTPNTGTFTVTRDYADSSSLTVHYSIAGSATNGTDYSTLSGTVTIPANSLSATFNVTPTNDSNPEAPETVQLTLSSNSAYTIGSQNSGTVTIADDDLRASVTATDDNAAEASANTGTFTISLNGAVPQAVVVLYQLSGTAAEGSDYIELPAHFVTIPANTTSQTVTITPYDDALHEDTETVVLTVQDGSLYDVGSPASDTVNIADNDLPKVWIDTTDANAREAATSDTATYRVHRDGTTSAALTVHFSVSGSSTATNGTDYNLSASTSIVIPVGQQYADITLTPINDSDIEGREAAILTLSTNSAYTIDTPSSATAYIEDDDLQVTVTASDAEAEENAGTGQFTFSLNGSVPTATTVSYTLSGTATLTTDYTVSPSGSVTIPANTTSATVTVTGVNDSDIEGNETAVLTITPDTANYAVGTPSSATVTIIEDDLPTITVSVPDALASEIGNDTGTIRLSRNGSTAYAVTVNVTIGGTATSGADYTAITTPVTIPIGQQYVDVSVAPIVDDEVENAETVILTAIVSAGYVLAGTGSGTVTIRSEGTDKNLDSRSTGQNRGAIIVERTRVEVASGNAENTDEPGDCPCKHPDRPSPRTTENPHPILRFEFALPEPLPELVEARLTFGGLEGESVFYDTTGLSAGQGVKLALQADATTLPTGRYDYEVLVTYHTGMDTTTRTFTGSHEVFNRSQSEFGNRRWIDGLDRLVTYAGGVSLIRGDSTAAWFAEDGLGGFLTPAGSFSTLESHVDGSYTLTQKDGSRDEFDVNGLLTARVDRQGNATAYSYTDADNDSNVDELAAITDPFGRAQTYTYTSGLLTEITDFVGRVTSYAYSGGRVTSMTEPDPDGPGGQNAAVTYYEYFSDGLIQKITDPDGQERTFTYDTAKRFASTTDDEADWSLSSVEVQGLVDTSTIGYDALNPAPASYLTADAVATYIDKRGEQTKYRTDAFGNVTEQEDALGEFTSYERDANGQVVRRTEPDPDGLGPLGPLVTEYGYDDRGNVILIVHPDSSTESWTYDATFSQVTSHVDQLGRVTLYDIDPVTGDVQSMTRVVGEIDDEVNEETDDVTTTYTYTTSAGVLPVGLLLTETDPLDRVMQYTYDVDTGSPSFGWLLSITEAVGTADEATRYFEYDEAGNIAASIDEIGRRTDYLYDDLDRLITTTDPDPDGVGGASRPVTQYVYDVVGNQIQVTDALNNVTDYEYDRHNRLTVVTGADPDGAGGPATRPETTYAYDGNGNRTSVIDPLGRGTNYEYDELNRLTLLVEPDPDGAGPLARPGTTYSYVVSGGGVTSNKSMTSQTDALGNVTSYRYDTLNRLVVSTAADPDAGGTLAAPTMIYAYDVAGQMVSMTDPLGRVTTYGYDELGRQITVTQPDPDGAGGDPAPVTHHAYDKAGNLISLTDALNNVTSYEYDFRDRRIQMTEADPDGGGELESPVTLYAYDDAGQLVSMTDPLNRVTTFEYDGLGRTITTTLPDPDDGGSLTSPVLHASYDAVGNLLTETDALNNVTTRVYDNLYRQVTLIEADPDGTGEGNPLTSPVTQYAYDAAGQLLSVTDPLERTTTYEYDGLGRQTTVTLPGRTALANGDPVTIDNGDAGYTVTGNWNYFSGSGYGYFEEDNNYIYGPGGTSADVAVWTFSDLAPGTYQVENYVVEADNRATNVTIKIYDGVTEIGSVTQDQYNATLTSVWEQLGEYTITGSTLVVKMFGNGDAYVVADAVRVTPLDIESYIPGPQYTTEYDSVGNVLSRTDALGNTTSYAYDHLHRQITLTEADPDDAGGLVSPVTHYDYDAAGQLVSTTDPLGRTTTFEYDGLGRQVRRILPGTEAVSEDPITIDNGDAGYTSIGNWTHWSGPEYEYYEDDNDHINGGTSSDVAVWTFSDLAPGTYFVENYVVEASNRATNVTIKIYDGGTEIGSVTQDQYSATIENVWEEVGEFTISGDTLVVKMFGNANFYVVADAARITPLDVAPPEPRPTYTTEYDLVGNVTAEIDPLGHTTEYAYDHLLRLTSETVVNGSTNEVTSFSYDGVGNRLSLTDPVGNTTAWLYDNLNRVIEEENELTHSRFFEYDKMGNLTQRTDRNGQVTQYVYDDLLRRTDELWKEGTTTVRAISYTFDAAGQLLSVDDPDASMEYEYDELGRVVSTTHTVAGLTPTVVLNQSFDAVGNRTELAGQIGGNNDFINSYVYDNLYRTTRIQQTSHVSGNAVADKRIDFGYDDASQLVSLGRFASLMGTDRVADSDFAYDLLGRMTSLVHSKDATTFAGYGWTYDAASRITSFSNSQHTAENATYDYDDRDQLIGADRAGALDDEDYAYDENGNRETANGQTYTTTDNNQLQSDGEWVYEYDEEGNLIRKTDVATGDNIIEYTWDHRNRLMTVTFIDDSGESPVITKSVEYRYDAFNRWVKRSEDADGDGIESSADIYFVQDGNQIVLEFDGSEAAALSHRYLWAPAVDQILADESVTSLASTGDVLWPLTDNLGTVRDLAEYDSVNDITTIAEHRVYDSFGNRIDTPFVDHLFGFTGRAFDQDTGLQNNLHRWYNSSTGRWINEDPVGFGAQDANLSRYVANAPLTKTDPTGQFWSILVTAAFAAVDTYDYLNGNISGQDYALRMAVNAVSLAADVLTAGQGGGLAVRGGVVAAKVAKAVTAAKSGARAVSVAAVGVKTTNVVARGIKLANTGYNGIELVSGVAQTAAGLSDLYVAVSACEGEPRQSAARIAFDTFRAGYGAYQAGHSIFTSPFFSRYASRPASNFDPDAPDIANFPIQPGKEEQGFSGVLDTTTGYFTTRPSVSQPGVKPPDGWVQRNGGHGQVLNEHLLPAKGGSARNAVGFTVLKRSDGTYAVNGMSGLNGPSRRLAPEHHEAVISAVQSHVGQTVLPRVEF